MYALEALELNKYSKFNILSIGCGTAPDLMAFNNIIKNKKISFLGIDISPTWYDIHNKIKRLSHNSNVNFQTKDIYKTLENEDLSGKFNVIILQYMIAGHIYSDRAEKLDFLFDKLIEKLIIKKPEKTPLMFIINDIDHKSWICDYFNLFIKKLRKAGLNFEYYKRHFESREENDGSKQYKERTNKFTAIISKEQKEKYNADAPCSAAQLIIEVK
jgi:SAM-dependent methyltransferase